MSEGLAVWGDETIRLLREANEVLHNANEEAMSLTPKTDAYMSRAFRGTYNEFIELADFARQLERDGAELATALNEAVAWIQLGASTVPRFEEMMGRFESLIAKASA